MFSPQSGAPELVVVPGAVAHHVAADLADAKCDELVGERLQRRGVERRVAVGIGHVRGAQHGVAAAHEVQVACDHAAVGPRRAQLGAIPVAGAEHVERHRRHEQLLVARRDQRHRRRLLGDHGAVLHHAHARAGPHPVEQPGALLGDRRVGLSPGHVVGERRGMAPERQQVGGELVGRRCAGRRSGRRRRRGGHVGVGVLPHAGQQERRHERPTDQHRERGRAPTWGRTGRAHRGPSAAGFTTAGYEVSAVTNSAQIGRYTLCSVIMPPLRISAYSIASPPSTGR
jgi:hypothetical protein